MRAGLVSTFSPWPVYYEAGGSAVPDISNLAHALEQLQTIWPVTMPLITTVGIMLASVVKYLWNRRDRSVDVSMTREQRLMAETDARIAQASKIDGDVMTRLQAELIRVSARMADLEQARDKAEAAKNAVTDRARYWHRRAHDMRYIALTATQTMMDAVRQSGGEPPATPNLSLPDFYIDPLPT